MKHMFFLLSPICEMASAVESIGASTRTIFDSVNCPDCLRRSIADVEARAQVLRDLLAKVEALAIKRCSVYDTACVNPSYCAARDACCAGDPDCRAEVP